MLQLQKGKSPTPYNAESSLAQQRNHSSLLLLFTVTKAVTSREISIPLGSRETKGESRKELTKRNFLLRPDLREKARRLFCFKADKGRTSPDQKSGEAI